MASFGKVSKERLATLDPRLQEILVEAIKYYDFAILCGHRDERAQNTAYNTNKSKLKWDKSKHNKFPSKAFDIAPYPIDWEDLDRFYFLAGIIFMIAKQKNIKIRWGRNWSMSWQFENQKFDDYPHFELV